ncbi:MAG: MoaD/ThiS family protein [Pseudomonadota bacterium]|nr:MoaD/ThiS family protein [Pseudomonadota bacterium]
MNLIQVRYFAGIRERLGRDQELVDAEGIRCASDVWSRVSGALGPVRVLVAINQEYAAMDHPVGPGDEIAFFPPVTGG